MVNILDFGFTFKNKFLVRSFIHLSPENGLEDFEVYEILEINGPARLDYNDFPVDDKIAIRKEIERKVSELYNYNGGKQ